MKEYAFDQLDWYYKDLCMRLLVTNAKHHQPITYDRLKAVCAIKHPQVRQYFKEVFAQALLEERIFLTASGVNDGRVREFYSTKRPTRFRSLDAGWIA